MIIEYVDTYIKGRLANPKLSQEEREALLAMANDELADELADMIDEADSVAEPMVLFSVCAVENSTENAVTIHGVRVNNSLVAEKLGDKKRCFPYVCTCGTALEKWSEQYKNDLLANVWADEIKKKYLHRMVRTFIQYIKETYRMSNYRAALNPGSRQEWPISGQQDLFDILGGASYVKEQIGVSYTDSYLMLPTKSVSGISFESKTVYENCQYCPLEDCPNRRAPRI